MAKSVSQIPGVVSADVNFAGGLLLLEYEAASDPIARVLAVVRGAGHGAEPLEPGVQPPAPSAWARYRAEIIVGASGALILIGWVLALAGAGTASKAAYALAILVGGTITWRRAAMSLAAKTLDMNVLMTIAVAGAAAIGEWGEGATVIFLFALGGALEARSLSRTRTSIRNLLDLAPEQARVRRAGREVSLPLADARLGETMIVRPGERVPLDGTIVSGASAFDESPITGESVPREKGEGDPVFAGSLNTTGLVEAVITAAAADTTLARIVELVEAAQATRAPVQRFIDRFSRVYTPAVIALAALVAVGMPALGSAGAPWDGFEAWREWAYRSLVLLVVSCPCALVISTPVAIVSAITRATRDGILVKGGAFLELAGKVRAIAFDKTGTLTYGRPQVVRTVQLSDDPAGHVLRVAAALEAHSNHPVARAVVAAAPEAALPPVVGLEETPGSGIVGVVGGHRYVVGSVRATGAALDAGATAIAEEMAAEGLSVVVLAREDMPGIAAVGLIGVVDAPRPGGPALVRELQRAGVEHIVMLTGDNEQVAARIAAESGVPEYRAGLLPDDKTASIADLHERYGVVAMVGDGINDAPALAAADLGIAMGAAGSDTAIEAADVALLTDDLSAVPGLLRLGRRTMANIRQNVTLSIAVKVVVLVLALLGRASLWMAVFADTGVALIVIANGMRLLRRPGAATGSASLASK